MNLKVSRDAPKIHAEVLSLQKKQAKRVQGQNFLSMLKATVNYLKTGARMKYRAAFVKTIQMLFSGLTVSKFDTTAIQARKRLNNDSCEQIRRLGPSGVIYWAATLVPSQWELKCLRLSSCENLGSELYYTTLTATTSYPVE